MGLRVAMRADASAVMGAGHVARCLTIAETLRARGATVRMLSRDLPPHLRAWILDAGHECVTVDARSGPLESSGAHAAWLGTSQAADADAVVAALADAQWDWMVVDHYAVGGLWGRLVRSATPRVCAIDDLADRAHACDVLLDQNLPGTADRYHGLVSPECRLLLGPRFALVRDEFRRARAHAGPRNGHITRVLVFVGGGDADNYTSSVVEACVMAGLGAGAVDVVIAPTHPARAAIEARCADRGYRCHIQTRNMAALMAAADFAIGATGSASWERCAVGLPTLAFATALNQEPILAGLAARGAVFPVPGCTALTPATLAEALTALRGSPAVVRAASDAAWSCVDGRGAERVCDQLEAVA